MLVKRVKRLSLLVVILLLSNIVGAGGIVASTSWVGAITRAAGAEEVTILAPLELRHPPEYDYKPQDVVKVIEADHIIWAGYEPFIKKLSSAYPEIKDRLIQVRTTNTPENLTNMTRMLARKFGTEDKQKSWEQTFLKEMGLFQERAQKANVASLKVAVNIHQNEFLSWLGFKPFFIFGGVQLAPLDITKILNADPDFIVDNYNSLDGKVMAENAKYVVLFNFPTSEYPELLDVMKENLRRLGL